MTENNKGVKYIIPNIYNGFRSSTQKKIRSRKKLIRLA